MDEAQVLPPGSDRKFFSSLGAGAVVLCNGYVPLVRLNYSAQKGRWVLPGGLLQRGEHPSLAARREVFEETGLDIVLNGVLAVRHRVHGDGSANVYWVFHGGLHKKVTALPDLTWPEEEIMEARFWPVAEALASPDVMPNTREFLSLADRSKPEQCFYHSNGFDEKFNDELYQISTSKDRQ